MTTTLKGFRKEVMERKEIIKAEANWRLGSAKDGGMGLMGAMMMARASIQLADLASDIDPLPQALHDSLNLALTGYAISNSLDEWPDTDQAASLPVVSVVKMQKAATAYLQTLESEYFGTKLSPKHPAKSASLYLFGLAVLDYIRSWDLTVEWVLKPYVPSPTAPEPLPSQIPNKFKHMTVGADLSATPDSSVTTTLVLAPPTMVGADELNTMCYRWLEELGIPTTALIDEVIIRFAPAFAGRNRGEGYLRSMFLGMIGDGFLVSCQTVKGKTFDANLSDPSVLSVLRDGGRANWNGLILKPHQVPEPALN